MNLQQEKFCHEYLVDFNATKAAIRAGYSEASAYSQGHDLLKKPEIKQNIRNISSETYMALDITIERVISEIVTIALSLESNGRTKLKALELLLNHMVIQKENLEKNSSNIHTVYASRALAAIKKLRGDL